MKILIALIASTLISSANAETRCELACKAMNESHARTKCEITIVKKNHLVNLMFLGIPADQTSTEKLQTQSVFDQCTQDGVWAFIFDNQSKAGINVCTVNYQISDKMRCDPGPPDSVKNVLKKSIVLVDPDKK